MRITVHNRGPEAATLTLLPHMWFRNTWSWGRDPQRPTLWESAPGQVQTSHPTLGDFRVDFDTPEELLFTENETNVRNVFNCAVGQGYFKDAFHDYVIHGNKSAVNPDKRARRPPRYIV